MKVSIINENKSSRLVHRWVVAGIISASARFIPVPFVDELVQSRCRKFVVSQTLAAYGREDLLAELESQFVSQGGCLAGCLAMATKAPVKLLLFPLRKVISIVTSVRGVPLEIIRTVLLGRTLQRYLERDALDPTQAEKMRIAFDESFARMDMRVVRAAMADALASVDGWKASAMQTAKEAADRPQKRDPQLTVGAPVDSGASAVEEVLDRPDTLKLFAEFDQRFDRRLTELVS